MLRGRDLPGVLLEVEFRQGEQELVPLLPEPQHGAVGLVARGRLRPGEDRLQHKGGGGGGQHREQDQCHAGVTWPR